MAHRPGHRPCVVLHARYQFHGSEIHRDPPAFLLGVERIISSDKKIRHGIYACSRASVPARVAMWKDARANGAPIVSTWLDDAVPDAIADPAAFWEKAAREIAQAERLVLYIEADDLPLRGALVEIGIALANNVPISIVAPGVAFDPVTFKPLGNWVKHPLVSFVQDVQTALEG